MLETKWIVSGSAFLTLLVRRDAATCVFLIGAIANAIFGKLLKAVFRVKRPEGSVLDDPGFPSSHAMSLFFFAAYLSAVVVNPPAGLASSSWWTPALLHAAAAAMSLHRVHSGLHTYRQVLGGAVFGWVDGRWWHRVAYGGWDLVARAEVYRSYVVVACVAISVVGGFVVSGKDRKLRAKLAFGKKGKNRSD